MNSAASEPALIGIDWGTSSLRAFLIGANGEVLDRVSSAEGIMQVKDRNFEAIFDRLISCWGHHAKLPVLASGMITSETAGSRHPMRVFHWMRAIWRGLWCAIEPLAGSNCALSRGSPQNMHPARMSCAAKKPRLWGRRRSVCQTALL